MNLDSTTKKNAKSNKHVVYGSLLQLHYIKHLPGIHTYVQLNPKAIEPVEYEVL